MDFWRNLEKQEHHIDLVHVCPACWAGPLFLNLLGRIDSTALLRATGVSQRVVRRAEQAGCDGQLRWLQASGSIGPG